MKGKKICDRCQNKITQEQKGVMLMTFKGNENQEKVYWHFDCYTEWINKSVSARAEAILNDSMKKAFPGINNILQQITDGTKSNLH